MTYLSPEWREKLIAAGFPESELMLGCSDEILRRLPPATLISRSVPMPRGKIGWRWRVYWDDSELKDRSEVDESLANAAAAMYCYLAEQKLLTPK